MVHRGAAAAQDAAGVGAPGARVDADRERARAAHVGSHAGLAAGRGGHGLVAGRLDHVLGAVRVAAAGDAGLARGVGVVGVELQPALGVVEGVLREATLLSERSERRAC